MTSMANTHGGDGAPESRNGFQERFAELMLGRNASAVAKAIGVNPSSLHRYFNGSLPAADVAIRLARALDVQVEWLIEGVGPKGRADVVGLDGPISFLPRYDLFAFSEGGKPQAAESIALPTAWLMSAAKMTNGLWLATMPNDAMPSVAAEGELLVCRDPTDGLQDRRVYVFSFEGQPVVRRVLMRPKGMVLRGDDPDESELFSGPEADQLRPIARVVAGLNFKVA